MAKKVSLINMKGGVGKSTLAVNLAWFFSQLRQKKVLLVDLDPQFNASQFHDRLTSSRAVVGGVQAATKRRRSERWFLDSHNYHLKNSERESPGYLKNLTASVV